MHSMQKSANAVLVPVHEFDDDFCGRALQYGPGAVPVATAGNGQPWASFVSGMVLVQPESGHVWLGAAGDRSAGLGLLRMERGPAKGQRLVHAQIADILAGGGRSGPVCLGDSSGATSLSILRYDRQAPRRASDAGMERRAFRYHSSLH